MLVVIDSNLLQNDYMFRNALLLRILAERILGYEVAISEATLYEHAKHYVNERRTAAKLMQKLDGELKAFVPVDHVEARALIRKRASKAGLVLLKLPRVAHHAVLDRAQRGIRPFEQEGHNGYSDTLIWETLKAAAVKQEVVLLSNDGDFGKESLHQHLSTEIAPLGLRVTLLKGYAAFIDVHINPRRAVIEQIQKDLMGPEGAPKREALEAATVKSLTGLRLPLTQSNPSSHYVRVDLAAPSAPLDFHAFEVRPLGDEKLNVHLVFTVEAPAIGEYWFCDNPEDPDSVERDWDEIDLRLLVEADAIVSRDLSAVESVSITSVEDAKPRPRDEHGE